MHKSSPTLSINIKVVFLGESSVGKTCLIRRLVENSFDVNTPSTIGASFSSYTYNSNNVEINFMFWDTSGEERFKSVAPSFIRGSEIGVIVFDLSEPSTFDNVPYWKKVISDSTNAKLIVVGSKSDLVSDEKLQSMCEDFTLRSNEIGAQFFPVSSKTGSGLKGFIDKLAELSTSHSSTESEMITLAISQPQKQSSCCK